MLTHLRTVIASVRRTQTAVTDLGAHRIGVEQGVDLGDPGVDVAVGDVLGEDHPLPGHPRPEQPQDLAVERQRVDANAGLAEAVAKR